MEHPLGHALGHIQNYQTRPEKTANEKHSSLFGQWVRQAKSKKVYHNGALSRAGSWLTTSIRQDSKSLPRINTLAYFARTEVTKKKQHRLPEWNPSREGSLFYPLALEQTQKSLPWINTLAYFVRTEVTKSNTAYLSGALQGRLPPLPIGIRVPSKSLLRLKTLAYFDHWLSNTVSLI